MSPDLFGTPEPEAPVIHEWWSVKHRAECDPCSDAYLERFPFTASQPYNGGSGSSGSSTSKDRETLRDKTNVTKATQSDIWGWIRSAGADGMTWKELQDEIGEHHGTISGALSNLHKEGRIARLSETRGGSKVYVLPVHVNGRTTEPQGRIRPVCHHCGAEQ